MNPFEHIEQYVDGSLEEEQLSRFERELASDPALQAEVSAYRDAINLLHVHQQVVYKQMLKDYDQTLASTPQAEGNVRRMRVLPVWLPYAVAAAVMLLILVGVWPTVTGNRYEEAFSPYPDRITLRNVPETDSLSTAMEHYNAQQYAQAAAILEVLHTRQPDQIAIQFYLGVAQFGKGSYEASYQTLLPIPKSSLFHPQAQWYRALSLGAAGEFTQAEEILDSLRGNESHPYHQASMDL